MLLLKTLVNKQLIEDVTNKKNLRLPAFAPEQAKRPD